MIDLVYGAFSTRFVLDGKDGFMDQWHERKRPVCLERRFEFDSYSATRDFLDRLGDFSEAKQRFPDISFGRTYVNITLRPRR